jgi:hypothetical protein
VPNRIGPALLAAFFAFGWLMALLASITLAVPGSPLDAMWTLNPAGHQGLSSLGFAGAALMFVVAVACGTAAVGLWRMKPWSYALAMGILALNLAGDLFNGVIRGDGRSLIGIPVALLLMLYVRRVTPQPGRPI